MVQAEEDLALCSGHLISFLVLQACKYSFFLYQSGFSFLLLSLLFLIRVKM